MRTLLVMPHMDDEVISCGGLIQRRLAQGAEVHVLCVYGRVYDFGREDGAASEALDFLEAKKVLGFHHHQLGNGTTLVRGGEPGQVGYFEPLEIVEEILRQLQPDEVVGPSRHDLNQEHRMLSHVLEIALRPVNRGNADRILEFHALDGQLRQPNFFLGLTEQQLQKKSMAIQQYRRERRTGASPRSAENVIAQARVWGAACGQEYAEAYTLIHGLERAT